MPLLSIIVPVYNVQAYLAECLDSLLGQHFTDLEIIAVDDCSPDRSGELLDRYAERDPRVRVVHLPANGGLGPARNAGLPHATGDYVWFVDSDDWVAEGAVQRVADRIAATTPDVLVTDYARAFWDGRMVRNSLGGLLADAPGGVFRVGEFPDLLRLFPGAWTKIVRREFLQGVNLAFPAGYYEDIPFTYPLLCAADRIAVLDQVSIYYRQRRHGSILRTSGKKHAVLIDQYQLVFDRLAALGERADPARPMVFDRMVDHLLMQLGGRGRIGGGSLQRSFFAGASRLCRQHEPAGWTAPNGVDRIRYRLLKDGSWPRYALVRKAFQTVRAGRDKARRLVGKVRGLARRVVRRIGRSLLYHYYRFQAKLPIDDNLAVYSIYWGSGYGCHSRAIYEAARELAPQVRGVWVVKREAAGSMPAGVDYVVRDTAPYYRALARAKYLVNNVNFLNFVLKRRGTVHLQTHHGTPIKSMGIDVQRYPVASYQTDYRALVRRSDRWDYSISSSPYCTSIWEHAYQTEVTTLEYGSPRNDALVDPAPETAARVRAELGIGINERVVLYAPTFREYRAPGEPLFDYGELADVLGAGSRLLVRGHHFDSAGAPGAQTDERVLDVTDHPDITALYLIADTVITDYSSVMFDYLVLDRPIVLFAPDWEVYRSVRGAYFDPTVDAPGLVTRTTAELLAAFRTGRHAEPEMDALRRGFRERFCPYDDGHAAERVVRKVFLGQDPTTFRADAPADAVAPAR